MTDLKPCPFCGRTPTLEYVDQYYWIACRCGLCTGQISNQDRVIESWNARAPLPLAKVEITDEMVEAVYAHVTPALIMVGDVESVRDALKAALAKAGIKTKETT